MVSGIIRLAIEANPCPGLHHQDPRDHARTSSSASSQAQIRRFEDAEHPKYVRQGKGLRQEMLGYFRCHRIVRFARMGNRDAGRYGSCRRTPNFVDPKAMTPDSPSWRSSSPGCPRGSQGVPGERGGNWGQLGATRVERVAWLRLPRMANPGAGAWAVTHPLGNGPQGHPSLAGAGLARMGKLISRHQPASAGSSRLTRMANPGS